MYMRRKSKTPGKQDLAQSVLRVQQIAHALEALVPELRSAVQALRENSPDSDPLADGRAALRTASRTLDRAASAVRALAEEAGAGSAVDPIRAVLESPLLSSLGSRVVLHSARAGAAPPAPSIGARALALLLEAPGKEFSAAELAPQLGCSVAVARTTLHRLVDGGHARRTAAGRFRAAPRP
jgi:hypothetical protein